MYIQLGALKFGNSGVYCAELTGEELKYRGPFKELSVVATPQAWISGRAVDAETGQPVRVNRAVLCFFERDDKGQVVLSGCRIPRFEQPEPGRFRIAYGTPGEFHITLSADGYHDAEAFTPKVTELKPINGIEVKMRKNRNGAPPSLHVQTLSGVAIRGGKPVRVGWAALWLLPHAWNAVNAPILRGRTVVGEPIVYASAAIRDGKYSLDVPYQADNWYVVVEEPNHPLTQIGPIKVALDQKQTLDISCIGGGRISGRVENVPAEWKGYFWVIAFSKTAVRAETRVALDGTFDFPDLPPGTYGLKAGHDAYQDDEIPRGEFMQFLFTNVMTNPWVRARKVNVASGGRVSDVILQWPP